MTAKDDPIRRARRQLKSATLPRLMRFRFTDMKPGRVTVRMPIRGDILQYRGDVHGGAICAVIDTAATFATNTMLPADRDSVTIELKTNFLKPARGRYLDATAEIVHHGRTTSITKVEVRRSDGVLCAYATVTNLIFAAPE